LAGLQELLTHRVRDTERAAVTIRAKGASRRRRCQLATRGDILCRGLTIFSCPYRLLHRGAEDLPGAERQVGVARTIRGEASSNAASAFAYRSAHRVPL
jgi:hypothetical protein